jgi:hypothetical protein
MVETGKIKTLNISASLDCWGPQAEYLRWGLKLSEWEKNFAYMAPQEWIILNVNLTITPLSIKTLPELIEKINAWDHDRLMRITAKNLKIPPEKFQDFQDKLLQLVEEKTDPRVDVNKHICISFMHVLDPTQMNPLWFGPGVFTEDMQRVVELMPGFTEFQRSFKTYMQGIAISIENTTRDPKKILMLETYMNEMDRRRGTKWSDLFPWLVDQFAQARTELGELGE